MKKIFFGILAIAAFAACSNEEQIAAPKGEAIAFGNAFVDNSVRAIDPSYGATNKVDGVDVTNHITSFKVWGTVTANQDPVLIYPGVVYTKGNAIYGEAWTPAEGTPTQYWIPGATYNFVGIVDGDKIGVTATTPVDGMPTAITYTADGETDLLCKKVQVLAGATNSIVGFTFGHLLSKVKFTVVNETHNVENYKYTVTGVKVANAYNTGVYNVVSEAWGLLESTSGQEFDDVEAVAASTECANEKLLLPLENAVVVYTVNLYYVDGSNEKLISSVDYTTEDIQNFDLDFVAGKAYNMTLTVKVGGVIEFTATALPTWDYTPGDTTIYPQPDTTPDSEENN